tara:strand:- start:1832 stop:3472 length:1641 start_codon:yes stop_codon:yes gene_type:complete
MASSAAAPSKGAAAGPAQLSESAQAAHQYMREKIVRQPDRDNATDLEDSHSYYLRSEQQHDFGDKKSGGVAPKVTKSRLNHHASNKYKESEAEIVSISAGASKASEAHEDADTLQGFLCITDNFKANWPRPAAGDRLVSRIDDDRELEPPDVDWIAGINTDIQKLLKGTWSRCYVEITDDKNERRRWQFSSIVTLEPNSSNWREKEERRRRLPKGRNILQALDIPTGSICIVDAQGAAGNFLKDLQIANSNQYYNVLELPDSIQDIRTEPKRVIYLYINPVIQADPAAKIKHTNTSLFNAEGDVELRALVSRRDVIVRANNGQLRMRYNIRHRSKGFANSKSRTTTKNGQLGRIEQTWAAVKRDGENDASARRRSIVVKDANNLNKISHIAKKFTSYHKGEGFDPGTAAKRRAAALGFQRKAGGDRFQGWTTVNIRAGPVTVYSYGKQGRSWKTRTIDAAGQGSFGAPAVLDIDEIRVLHRSGPVLSSAASSSAAASKSSNNADQFVITQDVPFLFWCLKNNVNVLFGSPGQARNEPRKYIYFKRL